MCTTASWAIPSTSRGWMLHFSADLTQTKTPGGFGWDSTASIVPASAVPSYAGTSSYLIFTKYNNYAGIDGGDGVNKIAVLDPNDTMVEPHASSNGQLVMKEVLSIAGPTPDPEHLAQFPNAVREWCINTAAVDPFTNSVMANSEDGKVYRWDLTTNTLPSDHAVAGHRRSVYADGHWSGWNRLRDQLGDPECRRNAADDLADADSDSDVHSRSEQRHQRAGALLQQWPAGEWGHRSPERPDDGVGADRCRGAVRLHRARRVQLSRRAAEARRREPWDQCAGCRVHAPRVAGLRTLDAEQRLACDVTGNGTLSALDATLILQQKVGLISRFPVAQACASDWLFVPMPAAASNQHLIQPQNMAAVNSCQPGAIEFTPLAGQVSNQDFAAVLVGDCTGNWQPASTTPAHGHAAGELAVQRGGGGLI